MRHTLSLLVAAALWAMLPSRAAAQNPPGVRLTGQYVAGQKMGLLVLPVRGTNGDSLTAMLARDFDYSDRFNVVQTTGPVQTGGPLNYALYQQLGAERVVLASALPTGGLRVELHDVNRKAAVNSRDFALPAPALSAAWRFGVHGVADAVEEWITSVRGIAATRIAFERGGRIWTVDSDGENLRAVTENGMSPQWTPTGRALVYNVLDGGRNPIMVVDLPTGAKRTLTSAAGMNDITPAVSPDGRTVAFARISENGTDIYRVPFEGGAPQRVTIGRGKISTQPSFSPDGQRIVFSSDRSGHNEVYICDVDGTNVEQLTTGTFGDREYRAGPDWAPNGQLIAYQSLNGSAFQIMTLNVRDQSTRQVTSDGRNDDPSWAPDARHLVVTSTRSGVRQLWVVDIESGRTRQLTRGAAARLSSWSPRLSAP